MSRLRAHEAHWSRAGQELRHPPRHWRASSSALAGCTSVPSQNVTTDRMDYGTVVAKSWKRQTLLNVVRLRYADAPVFLNVASIVNSYTVGGNANVQAQIPSHTDPNVFQAGVAGNWSNTPTVTYQPLIGDRFTRSLLTPIPPVSIYQLLQGGWPATVVFQTVVGSINGLRNASTSIAAVPGFLELTEAGCGRRRSVPLALPDGPCGVRQQCEAAPASSYNCWPPSPRSRKRNLAPALRPRGSDDPRGGGPPAKRVRYCNVPRFIARATRRSARTP